MTAAGKTEQWLHHIEYINPLEIYIVKDEVSQSLWQYDQNECQILRKNAKSWGSMKKC